MADIYEKTMNSKSELQNLQRSSLSEQEKAQIRIITAMQDLFYNTRMATNAIKVAADQMTTAAQNLKMKNDKNVVSNKKNKDSTDDYSLPPVDNTSANNNSNSNSPLKNAASVYGGQAFTYLFPQLSNLVSKIASLEKDRLARDKQHDKKELDVEDRFEKTSETSNKRLDGINDRIEISNEKLDEIALLQKELIEAVKHAKGSADEGIFKKVESIITEGLESAGVMSLLKGKAIPDIKATGGAAAEGGAAAAEGSSIFGSIKGILPKAGNVLKGLGKGLLSGLAFEGATAGVDAILPETPQGKAFREEKDAKGYFGFGQLYDDTKEWWNGKPKPENKSPAVAELQQSNEDKQKSKDIENITYNAREIIFKSDKITFNGQILGSAVGGNTPGMQQTQSQPQGYITPQNGINPGDNDHPSAPGMIPKSSTNILNPSQTNNNPDQTNNNQSSGVIDRSGFAEELSNPEIRKRLYAFLEAEVGSQGSEAQQGVMETIFNRASARGKSLAKILSGKYFPPETYAKVTSLLNKDLSGKYNKILEEVRGGSNISDYATGNASGPDSAFREGPFGRNGYQTKIFNGEKVGVEDGTQGWVNSMKRRNQNNNVLVNKGGPFGVGTPPDQAPKDPSGQGLVKIRSSTGKEAWVAAAAAPQMQGALNDLEAAGMNIKQLGGYNYRNIANTNRLSGHALGYALDINEDENGVGQTNNTFPKTASEIFRKWGLGWGAEWKNKKDPMHVSVLQNEGGRIITPDELKNQQTSNEQPKMAEVMPPNVHRGSDILREKEIERQERKKRVSSQQEKIKKDIAHMGTGKDNGDDDRSTRAKKDVSKPKDELQDLFGGYGSYAFGA